MFLRQAILAGLFVALVSCSISPPSVLPEPLPSQYDFDLNLDGGTDRNGFLLNPQWKNNADAGTSASKEGCPDPTKCSWRFIQRDSDPTDKRPPCNRLPVDPDFSNTALTEVGGSCLDSSLNMRGHINWERAWHKSDVKGGAVTFVGPVKWDSFSGEGLNDGDFNFVLSPPAGAVLTPGSSNVIKLEYDSREVKHFASQWWKMFANSAIQNDTKICCPERLVGSRIGIVTGLLGIDTEHNSHLEVHPVYAMALNVPCPLEGAFSCKNKADGDKSSLWALFVRDQGNQGGCSRADRVHVINLTDGYVFRIRGPQNARSIVTTRIHSEFCTSNRGAGSVELRMDMLPNDPGVLATFHIPWRGSIDGYIELQWADDKQEIIPNSASVPFVPATCRETTPSPVKVDGSDTINTARQTNNSRIAANPGTSSWVVNFVSGEKVCDSLRPEKPLYQAKSLNLHGILR